MSIASNLQSVASSLSDVLSAINTKLTAKGSTAASTLSAVPNKINAIPTGTVPTETKNITENGTYDVINYASAVVAVPEPTGTKSITENGTYDVSGYASAEVDVDVTDPPTGTVNIDTNGTHNVANYASANVNVPTGTARSSSDLTVSGNTVTVPAGLYSSQASKQVSTVTQATPSISVNTSTGVVTASASQSAGYVTSGSKSATYSLTTQGAQTITPGTSDQTISSGKYLTGTQTIKGDADLVASNIKNGVNIFGVTGTYSGGASLVNESSVASAGTLGNKSYHSDGDTDTMTIQMGSVNPSKLVGVLLTYTDHGSDLSNKEILSCLALKATSDNSANPVIFTRYGNPGETYIYPSGNVTFNNSSIVITTDTYFMPFSPSSGAYTATAIVSV